MVLAFGLLTIFRESKKVLLCWSPFYKIIATFALITISYQEIGSPGSDLEPGLPGLRGARRGGFSRPAGDLLGRRGFFSAGEGLLGR